MIGAVAVMLLSAWSDLPDAGRAAQIAALSSQPLPARLLTASRDFLGTPYVVSPLGEGEGRDRDPLLRFDAVDCLTFVEETMALATTPTPDALLPTLSDIRYHAAPAWEAREHVMEAQWLPGNIARGHLKDVTRALGGAAVVQVMKRLDDRAWASPSGAALALPRAAQPRGDYLLDVIPPQQAVALLGKAPEGTVVVVVRADRPNLVTRVSHVGFLVHGSKGPMLRHASRTFGKVVDEPLAAYVGRNLGYAKWTVAGFALFEVQPLTRP